MWHLLFPLLFLTSMFLISQGFPGSGSMSSTLKVSLFMKDDPHENPLCECFLLNCHVSMTESCQTFKRLISHYSKQKETCFPTFIRRWHDSSKVRKQAAMSGFAWYSCHSFTSSAHCFSLWGLRSPSLGSCWNVLPLARDLLAARNFRKQKDFG